MDSAAAQVKERLSIVEVVGGYVQLQKAGRNMRARCPFHKERTPSFMVSPERGTYMCFGCGEKGDIFSFIEKMESIDFRAALEQLAERAGVKLPKYAPVAPEVKARQDELRDRLLACSEEAARFFQTKLAEHKKVQDYLRSRALKDATAAAWRVGYAPATWDELSKHLFADGFTKDEIVGAGLGIMSEKKKDEVYDRFRGRIMFPIFDNAGKVIAFSGRFFEKVSGSRDEGEPAKYVNSPETMLFRKSRVLYGLHAAKETMRKADCILLVEGQFDVLLAHQSGLRFAVAVSGTALTPEHLSLLSRYSKRLVLALDNDAAGLRSGLKSTAMALASGFDVKVPKLPEDLKDPADAAAKDPEILKAAVRESRTAIEFFLDALRTGARDERAYKKSVESQVLPLVAALPSRIDQSHFITIVANRLRVPEDAVRSEVAKKPRIEERADTPTQLAPAAGETNAALSRLEQAAAMILVRSEVPDGVRQELEGLLGTERLAEIQEKAAPQAEALRFQFDSLEENENDIFAGLLETIAQGKLDEDIESARVGLHEAQITGDSKKEAELLRQIIALAKEKHSLKK